MERVIWKRVRPKCLLAMNSLLNNLKRMENEYSVSHSLVAAQPLQIVI